MGRGVPGAVMRLLRAENLPCTVTEVWMHTETMKAIRVASPEFIRSHRPAEGEYLRCWLAHPEQPTKEAMRGYTMVDIDYDSGEFTLLFLLHQPAGPATAWAAAAQVGDSFEASYYGSAPFEVPAKKPRGFVLIADAAGIPYVNAMADQLADDFEVLVWMLDWRASDHEIPLREHENLTVEWIAPTAEDLLRRAQDFDWQGWFAHLICEAKILLATRRYLLKEAGLTKHDMHVHAYWAQGKAMGSSRDTRAD